MTPEHNRYHFIRGNQLVGALVGALVGSILRMIVAVSFIFYVRHWGGKWWGNGETDIGEYRFAAVSGAIGLIAGGLAGLTCRPYLGAFLGGVLSAGFCIGLFVLPGYMGIGMSTGPTDLDKKDLLGDMFIGLFAMTIAGAMAGAIGATVGRNHRKKT